MNSLAWFSNTSSLRVWETYAVLLAIVAAFVLPRAWERRFGRLEVLLKTFAQRPVLTLVVAFAAPILLRIALNPLLHTPAPWVHDEFCNLLAADTFLHGRVANPQHPYWKFFETMHVIWQPAYASMYPPAQGIFLAAGRLLTDNAYAGVLISSGLLSASLLWMLRAWLPAEWALAGAALAVIRIGLFSYWANSYWGGAPGAIGGALVAGSIPRIFRQQRVRDAILLGFGLVLLANSRPFEGFFFSIPFGIAFLVWLVRGNGLRTKLSHAAIPLCVVLIAGAGAMAYYNWRITGNPLEFPEMREKQIYSVAPNLLWQKLRPEPLYNNSVMRSFYVEREPVLADVPRSTMDEVNVLWRKGQVVFYFFLGPLLAAPLILGAPAIARNKKPRLLLAAIGCIGIGVACERWYLAPHYFGPATSVIYALVLYALAEIWNWKQPAGRFLVRGIFAMALLLAVVRIVSEPLGIRLQFAPQDWSAAQRGDLPRAALVAALNSSPDRFLVVVRYQPFHVTDREWVYNDADIDNAKIVWARDLGPETDELVKYFRDRRAIVVEPDVIMSRPYPYSGSR